MTVQLHITPQLAAPSVEQASLCTPVVACSTCVNITFGVSLTTRHLSAPGAHALQSATQALPAVTGSQRMAVGDEVG